MTDSLEASMVETIARYDSEKRYTYLLKEVSQSQQIWILNDEDGCVMLNTEDDDCVPVWPNKEFAEAWATGEWADCKAKGIDLKKWLSDWTPGLEEDELAIVIFPNHDEDGLVVYPDEFDHELRKKAAQK
jgi:hypothetical protein